MIKSYKHTISIIIVNYNVEFYLEQCLNSVLKATNRINHEIFVVDNNSIDGSVNMIKNKFPNVKLIENKFNAGFSKANNQAIDISKSKYVLLLNPDTVVEENTFQKIIDFVDKDHEIGACGVRMVDGKGRFLPESKRGLPTPSTSLYYLFGLSKIFKNSKKFNNYHLGYLNEFENHEVDILSGAFMFIRSKALDQVGTLDETFFMYGEDIDLSYRIKKGGYKNYYFSETSIIHYKGESTKKSSVNYVLVFYKAMSIFAQKHFSKKQAKSLSTLINMGIYMKAGMALFNRFIKKTIFPFTDFLLIMIGLYALTVRWEVKGIVFPDIAKNISIPLYTLIWLFFVWVNGIYDRSKKTSSFLIGLASGSSVILILYALLPKEWQFSRLFIILGGLWVLLYFLLSRSYFNLITKGFIFNKKENKSFAIVGENSEYDRVKDLLSVVGYNQNSIYHVSSSFKKEEKTIGSIMQLDQIAHIYKIDEIIFCAKNTAAKDIIHWMSLIPSSKVEFKIAQPDTSFLIGSNSIESSGDVYILNINSISKQDKQRKKRILDFCISLILICISPIFIFLFKRKKQFITNMIKVFLGIKTFVGYTNYSLENHKRLPHIKSGILSVQNININSDKKNSQKLDIIYARDYKLSVDLKIILNNYEKLDQ